MNQLRLMTEQLTNECRQVVQHDSDIQSLSDVLSELLLTDQIRGVSDSYYRE